MRTLKRKYAIMRRRDFALVAFAILASTLLRGYFTPPWPVEVSWDLQLDPRAQSRYQHMADVLSAFTKVPNDRVNFYADCPNVNKWAGTVTHVRAVAGGYEVTVHVDPVTSAGFTYASDYSENYFIDGDNAVTYLGPMDPDGSSPTPLETVDN